MAANLKRIREGRFPRVSQTELAEMLKMGYAKYQSAELGRSVTAVEEASLRIKELWGVTDDELQRLPSSFATVISGSALESEMEVQVDIPLHEPTTSGKVTLLNKTTRNISVPSDLARLSPIALVVPDSENLPRFVPGQRVIGIPISNCELGQWLIVEHKTETVEMPDGSRLPVAYIRLSDYRGGRRVFAPLADRGAVFTDDDVNVRALIVFKRTVHTEGWNTDERCNTGLPKNGP